MGDVVLVHRDSIMHKSKQNYEHMEPYENDFVSPSFRNSNDRIAKEKRYENLITKAVKEQLRSWPSE